MNRQGVVRSGKQEDLCESEVSLAYAESFGSANTAQ